MNTLVPTSSKLFKTAASAGKIMMLVFGFLLVFGSNVYATAPVAPTISATNVSFTAITTTTVLAGGHYFVDRRNSWKGVQYKQGCICFQGVNATANALSGFILAASEYRQILCRRLQLLLVPGAQK